MVKSIRRLTIGNTLQTQKNVANNLIKVIKAHQKKLQVDENIKYGRRARSVTFVYASSDFAKRVGELK